MGRSSVGCKNEIHCLLQSVGAGRPRDERRRKTRELPSSAKAVGVNRVIRVVSTGDLTFAIDEGNSSEVPPTMIFPVRDSQQANAANLICLTTSGFALTLLLLLAVLLASCGLSAYLCLRLRPFRKKIDAEIVAVRGYAVRTVGAATLKSSNKPPCFYS
jgi:hypothetical protein